MRTARIAATIVSCMLAGSLVACGNTPAQETAAPADATQQEEPQEEQTGQARVTIGTEGMGEISWAYEGEDVVWDDEFPYQSAVINDALGQTLTIAAKEDPNVEGYVFSKWTKDGQDYSTEPEIQVEVDGDATFVAVFEATEA